VTTIEYTHLLYAYKVLCDNELYFQFTVALEKETLLSKKIEELLAVWLEHVNPNTANWRERAEREFMNHLLWLLLPQYAAHEKEFPILSGERLDQLPGDSTLGATRDRLLALGELNHEWIDYFRDQVATPYFCEHGVMLMVELADVVRDAYVHPPAKVDPSIIAFVDTIKDVPGQEV